MLLRKFALPPVAKAALTSCTMMAAGDVVMQRLQHAQLAKESKAHAPAHALDWARTARFAVIGLTLHGPLFYAGFKQLDKLLGTAPTLGTAFKKVVVGQFTLFPVYLTAFFSYMGALEGLPPRQCLEKVQAAFMPTYSAGSMYWPVVNMFNFMYVPGTMRVAYINVAGLAWNAYLSWANTRTHKQSEPVAIGQAAGGGAAPL